VEILGYKINDTIFDISKQATGKKEIVNLSKDYLAFYYT